MANRFGLHLGLCSLLLFAATGCNDEGGPGDYTQTNPLSFFGEISVDPSTLDLGDVAVDDTASAVFTINNDGQGNLIIYSVELTEGSDTYSLEYDFGSDHNLAAGTAVDVTVIGGPSSSGEHPGQVLIRSNDEQNQQVTVVLSLNAPSGSETATPTVERQTPGEETPGGTADQGTPGEETPGGTAGQGTPGEETPGGTADQGTPGEATPEPTPTQEPDIDGDGFSVGAGDCDDTDATSYPGADEICDEADNNCNGLIDDNAIDQESSYLDSDNDGSGDSGTVSTGCNTPAGYVNNSDDCNDSDSAINPNADELCNGLDDNCDGSVDNDPSDVSTYYIDADGDGHGVEGNTVESCNAPDGYAATNGDCDDNNNVIYPNATEACDDLDNDCDLAVDEEGQSTWYQDSDNDGYGTTENTQLSCGQPDGFASQAGDCDDANGDISPGAEEICNGADENCNDEIDENFDQDGDGHTSCAGDCNDNDAAIHPGAEERCDGLDQNCDDVIDDGFDTDGDGYTVCGTDETPRDCDDDTATTYPNADEQCNAVDDDCDESVDENVRSTFYRDADGDGYGTDSPTIEACEAPDGYAAQAGDCNDFNSVSYPDAPEFCDTQDNDCDDLVDEGVTTTYFLDADQDTYGSDTTSQEACQPPSPSHVNRGDDCNDLDNTVYPNASELCDGKDNNCDDVSDEGFDNDNDGVVTCEGDCNDNDNTIFEGADEICDNLDNNCNGTTDEGFDNDSDGITSCDNRTGGPDCNDNDPQIRPGVGEVCDGKDNNCNGETDEGYDNDDDGFTTCGGDCDDNDASINPAAEDEPFDTIDSNCDGLDAGGQGAVYVSESAAPDGDGSLDTPMNSLVDGVALAQDNGAFYILVSEGTYNGSITLFEGLQLLGGYNDGFTSRDSDLYVAEIIGSAPTTEQPAAINASDINLEPTLVEGFRISSYAGSAAGSSSVGIYALNTGDSLVLRQLDLIVGPGNAGGNGQNGLAGTEGEDGGDGFDSHTVSQSCESLSSAAAGGPGLCGDVTTTGGAGGALSCPVAYASQPSGSPGFNGDAPGGDGGSNGSFSNNNPNGCDTCYIDVGYGAGGDGSNGPIGDDGGSGSGGDSSQWTFEGSTFVALGGQSGELGSPGGGGGGGGTGSGAGADGTCSGYNSHAGGMGGGGGSGACGGEGGTGGNGGGGSFGLMLQVDNDAITTLPQLIDSVIAISDGGAGGKGGDGGLGGIGGIGGLGGEDNVNNAWCSGVGGVGGLGGDGGTGGGGGGGAGGPSYGLLVTGAEIPEGYTEGNLFSLGRGGRGGRGGFGGRGIYGEDGGDGGSGESLALP